MAGKKSFGIDEMPLVIRKMRKLAGLSQHELADLAQVGKALIFEIEKGHKKVTFEKLQKVCRVLNIKLEFKVPIELELDE